MSIPPEYGQISARDFLTMPGGFLWKKSRLRQQNEKMGKNGSSTDVVPDTDTDDYKTI